MQSSEKSDFIPTPWSLLLTKSDDTEQSKSLQILCHHYRDPVHAFFQKHRWESEDADDLTQSFFAFLIEKEIHKQADPSRGRFRSFLLTSAKNFLLKERRYNTRQKRSSDRQFSLNQTWVNDHRISDDLFEKNTPDREFDSRWAMALFDEVWDQLEEGYISRNKQDRFEALAPCLMQSEERDSYHDLALRLSMSESAVKSAVHRLRERFRDLFRQAVARLVESPSEIDDEIRYLLNIIREDHR